MNTKKSTAPMKKVAIARIFLFLFANALIFESHARIICGIDVGDATILEKILVEETPELDALIFDDGSRSGDFATKICADEDFEYMVAWWIRDGERGGPKYGASYRKMSGLEYAKYVCGKMGGNSNTPASSFRQSCLRTVSEFRSMDTELVRFCTSGLGNYVSNGTLNSYSSVVTECFRLIGDKSIDSQDLNFCARMPGSWYYTEAVTRIGCIRETVRD